MNIVHKLTPCNFISLLIAYFHSHLGHPSSHPPSFFLIDIVYDFITSLMHFNYPAHLILLDLITLLFGEETLHCTVFNIHLSLSLC
jgi:hypothetical protein